MVLTGMTFSLPAQVPDPFPVIPEEEKGYLLRLYQDLHRAPELSHEEKETSRRLCRELDQLGLAYAHPVGGYGIAGMLENGDGPVILLRTDMDALPLEEKTGAAYASKVTAEREGRSTGVMHACGHDLHMAVWVGTLRFLDRFRHLWRGSILFVAQGAEETGRGARQMLEDGLYDRFPRPDLALAWHTSADLPAGSVGICPGWAMANVDMITVRVKGVGGHGAMPHLAIDPVLTAARIIVGLQPVISRETSPFQPAVITVGAIHGGTAGNIIPDEVRLELTVRSFGDEQRQTLLRAIERVCRGEALAAGVPDSLAPDITVRDMFTPALFNDPSLASRARNLLGSWLGADRVVEISPQTIGEDFSRYGRVEPPVPALMLRLGTVTAEDWTSHEEAGKALPGLHAPDYLPDAEQALPVGIAAMARLIADLAAPSSGKD